MTAFRKLMTRLTLAATLFVGCIASAHAVPITYSVEGLASGTLGANTFTNEQFSISWTSDTSNVTGAPGFYSNQAGSGVVSFAVAGLGSGWLLGNALVYANQSLQFAGFGADGATVLSINNALFASYDLMTDIGPVAGGSFIRPDIAFSTSLGGLILTSVSEGSFEASLSTAQVPEPGSLALIGLGLAGLAVIRRRKA